MDEVRSHVCLDLPSLNGKADPKIVPLILESHTGRAFAPSPKRSTSPQATSTLEWLDSLKALDPNRPIREADMSLNAENIRFWGVNGHSDWPNVMHHTCPRGLHLTRGSR